MLSSLVAVVAWAWWMKPTNTRIAFTIFALFPSLNTICPRPFRTIIGNTVKWVNFFVWIVVGIFLLVTHNLLLSERVNKDSESSVVNVIVCVNARANAVVSLATVNNISLKGANATVNRGEVAVAVSASHDLRTDYSYMNLS
jgi:hypothetical protein